ncbi:hypothetical protein F5890DRAFT_1648943 [Lentinula detonsa]|uniref:Cyclin N-terminal domain-containing protein n=1 Tax=Lentinula detonsa TaxID=2804962 RepID=A0AA38Q0Q8_9AGAR|nr:hypothetical protein F5890DRAFT_1648943 [Lentinula detonsa]
MTATTTSTTSSRVHRRKHVASSTAPRVHHASLVHPSTHSPVLLKLVDSNLSLPFIDYIANFVADALDSASGLPAFPLGDNLNRRSSIVGLKFFIRMLFGASRVQTPVILAALAFIDKAKHRFDIKILQELPLERTLLSAIVVASKALNDHTMNNMHWQRCSTIFRAKEISRFELEFLDALCWNLRLTDSDILVHYDSICTHYELYADPSTPNRSAPHQRSQKQCANTRIPEDYAKHFTHSSASAANTSSSSKISHPYHNSNRRSKSKSPFRRWIKSLHLRFRHSSTTAVPLSIPQ